MNTNAYQQALTHILGDRGGFRLDVVHALVGSLFEDKWFRR